MFCSFQTLTSFISGFDGISIINTIHTAKNGPWSNCHHAGGHNSHPLTGWLSFVKRSTENNNSSINFALFIIKEIYTIMFSKMV